MAKKKKLKIEKCDVLHGAGVIVTVMAIDYKKNRAVIQNHFTHQIFDCTIDAIAHLKKSKE